MFSGTDVARDAGDIILLDNSFASLVTSIETGRLLSDNIKKVCLYLLPAGSWSELMPFLANIWLGVPLALTSFLAIAFCVFNDVCNALALVNEPAEKNIMERPPVVRNKERLVNGRLLLHAYLFLGTLETLSAFFCFCWYWTDQGYPVHDLFLQYSYFGTTGPDLKNTEPQLLAAHLAVSQSIYYVSLVILQFFNLFSTRTRYESFFSHNAFYGKGRNLYLPVGV
jgi:sodium/potassium-transporting ATPase subunit alpha